MHKRFFELYSDQFQLILLVLIFAKRGNGYNFQPKLSEFIRENTMQKFFAAIICACTASIAVASSPAVLVNQKIWSEFSAEEKIGLASRFPNIEVIPIETVGAIQSSQVVNRSTAATHGGALIGSAVGQASYIDRAFKGSGSNYSAISHLGVALLGGAIGSMLDAPGQTKFLISYGIRTADGQVREVRVESGEEIALPVGRCVYLQNLSEAPASLCIGEKFQFLKQLSEIGKPNNERQVSKSSPLPVTVACRVPNVGLLTLEPMACNQLEGVVEK